jgi:hypothetical protein
VSTLGYGYPAFGIACQEYPELRDGVPRAAGGVPDERRTAGWS